jgi:CheY-like chemotaxis protein
MLPFCAALFPQILWRIHPFKLRSSLLQTRRRYDIRTPKVNTGAGRCIKYGLPKPVLTKMKRACFLNKDGSANKTPGYMNKNGPIVIIEDDADDQELLGMVFNELNFPNPVKFFSDGKKAFDFLMQDDIFPFLIISDINMPKLDGFELKGLVHTNNQLSQKCIPYLFFTTSANQQAVFDAYKMSVQGFFLKPTSYPELLNTIRVIIEYWQQCYSPASYPTQYTHAQDS